MKVTYSWLKELVDIAASVEEVASALTAAGLEVETVEKRHIPDRVIVARVTAVKKHPDADRLSLCTVDTGDAGTLLVVCGAQNVGEGMCAALATLGCRLGPDMKVKKTRIRGVESSGMLCSERELGISSDHSGIMQLPEDYTPGKPLNEYYPEDAVITIDLTANRGDCLSILGVAREVSAAFGVPVKSCAVEPVESGGTIHDHIKVTIKDAQRCPRYMGRLVRGVKVGESPQWLKQRLSVLGIRPISNVVDVTNYILLLFGQPMHAFDYAKIAGKEIIVQRAEKESVFSTLDDVEHTITPEDLLICDGGGPVAIAGVMGGAGTEIGEQTTDVFLECAYFDPAGIRKTAKRLDLSTDSSYRFERGVDPDTGLVAALDTATEMIRELAGGEVVAGRIDAFPGPLEKKKISLRPAQVARLLGVSISSDKIVSSLSSLDIRLKSESDSGMVFEAPLFRHDLTLEVDLIEEVGRLHGYNNIPAAMSATIYPDQGVTHVEQIMETVRMALAGAGLHETVTNSMTSREKCRALAPDVTPVVVTNPLSPEMSVMRPTLLGSLLEVTAHNLNRKNTDNRLFEIGKAFSAQEGAVLPLERDVVGILIQGNYLPQSWENTSRPVSFSVLKSIVGSLRSALGLAPFTYARLEGQHPVYSHEAATFTLDKAVSGSAGRVRQEMLERFGVNSPVYYAELDICGLLKTGVVSPTYAQLPRFPAIERDLCFVMREDIPCGAVTHEIRKVSELVEHVEPFDVYHGEELGAGQKSIAYAVRLRAPDRTLTDPEADKVCETVVHTLKSGFDAELRSAPTCGKMRGQAPVSVVE